MLKNKQSHLRKAESLGKSVMLDPSGLLSTAGLQDHTHATESRETLTASSDFPKLLGLLCPTGNNLGAEQLLHGCSPVPELALGGQRDSRLGEPSQGSHPNCASSEAEQRLSVSSTIDPAEAVNSF